MSASIALGMADSTYPSYIHINNGWSDDEGSSHAPKHPSGLTDVATSRRGIRSHGGGGLIGPQSKWVQELNRAFLLVSAAGLLVDPLFFYALSISGPQMCLFVDGWFALSVTLLRCMTDTVHLWSMWMRIKTAYNMRRCNSVSVAEEERGTDAKASVRAATVDYLMSKKGFFFDLFVILPAPQVALWIAVPALIRKGETMMAMNVFLIVFLFQYVPKIYHSICFLRRMQNVSGYIFGTIWWGIALNFIAYLVASHAIGGCWYLLGIQRATKCLNERCVANTGCSPAMVGCISPIYYGTATAVEGKERLDWAKDASARATCLDSRNQYDYGAFRWAVLLFTNTSRLEKILLPLLWGLMTLSTFGNLESTTEWLEIVFNIITITGGLILVTMLIGNIKVFLNATTSKKQSLHLRMRSMDWWMKKKHLPQRFRQRVRQYERQRWARGVDECEMVRNLPEGLRRDIKYHLCLDLVRQVPLFQHMDELVLENICDRVKSLIFPKGEIITREGDPVQRMLFVRGRAPLLVPERLPPSSSTLITLETTEAFGLEASDVKYVTQHFRYTFVNEKVRRSARYYSPGWRTWAAVAIQLAWRRYRRRKTLTSLSFIRPRRPLSRCSSLGEEKLRLYTALLTSPKPDVDEFLL
ncbi:uncharacterized protein A4U43_C07F39690 [Asparagus officinalis]|uniref:Cyclic nucleotide-binding domain-containing protein n=1 Tax=Asparagus officinalis TaxID=4686 RepID=A0A5P1ENS8_ASPOF|nr:uncharacterized protein A4U43_C07F39690 [Asparagus officinalis]